MVVDRDIEVFNQYALDNHQALKNCGHDINKDDMMECLLDVYLLDWDNKFHAYIIQLKTSIDDGALTQRAEQLMGKALNFYKPCKENGAWGQKSQDNQKIVVLSEERWGFVMKWQQC